MKLSRHARGLFALALALVVLLLLWPLVGVAMIVVLAVVTGSKRAVKSSRRSPR